MPKHLKQVRALMGGVRLHKHNLMISPSKARLGATDANCLGHSISPAGIRPNAETVLDLIKCPCSSTSSKTVRWWAAWDIFYQILV